MGKLVSRSADQPLARLIRDTQNSKTGISAEKAVGS